MKYVSNIIEGNILHDTETNEKLVVLSINYDNSCTVQNIKNKKVFDLPHEKALMYVSFKD